MVTKAIITSINSAGNRCVVRMPLFETASSSTPILAEALINITPGVFNNLFVGDVVFVAFEENALEKPIIIGKLFTNTQKENATKGGAGIFDSIKVKNIATLPAATTISFPDTQRNEYKNLDTLKKIADYSKWLEKLFKKLIKQLQGNFNCFKSWTQWQLRPENVEIDDGDIDTGYHVATQQAYQTENGFCQACGNLCEKNNNRHYDRVDTTKSYPEI